MYSAAQLWMDRAAFGATTNLSRRDDWVENAAKFCAAAGWTIRVNGAIFTVTTTTTFMLSYKVFAIPPDDDVFWRIIRNDNGQFIHVIDEPKSDGTQPPGRVLRTGLNPSPATLHAKVVLAIMILLQDKGITPTPLGPLDTRMTTDSPRNDFLVNMSIGSSLRSGTTDTQAYAGFVCTSQPSRKRYLKGAAQIKTAGGDNYISIYLTSKVEGGGDFDNNMIHVAGAKSFAAFATDTPILDGEQAASTFGRTGAGGIGQKGLERMGQLDIARTIAFADPYQLILHVEGAPEAFIHAAALKLIDFRTSAADDLPVTSANFFAARRSQSGGRSFRAFGVLEPNVLRVEVNSKAFYGSQPSESAKVQLGILRTTGDNAVSKLGVRWGGDGATDDIGEVCEPWIVMSPKSGGTGFAAGELWDAMSIYERTPEPTMGRFVWDSQPWIRYTKDAQSLAAGEVPFTLCLRATRKFIPPK